jgi:predicted TIM-barrel fold metal-dependent hydrolase
MAMMNRFISVHALGFVFYNMVHMTNWIINGLPERFPKLKVIWIESGLAWLPFMIQRLDNEYMMRSSERRAEEAAGRLHPRHVFHLAADGSDRPRRARDTFRMIKAETQLLIRPTIRTGTSTCRARSTTCRS